jgi:uncharacterized sulfatase
MKRTVLKQMAGFAAGLLLACCLNATAAQRPNVLVVILDDFGIGQFAPVSREVELGQLDPAFLAYTLGLGDEAYDPKVALEAARRAMPFMDSLVGQGVMFSRAFAANSLCSPSRASLLTGTNSVRWGGYRNIDINVTGLPQGRSLVGRLQAQGYRTAIVGKWHLGERDEALRQRILAAGGTEKDAEKAGYLGSCAPQSHPLNHGFDYAFFYNRWQSPYYETDLIWENHTHAGRQTEYNTDLFTRKAVSFIEQALERQQPFFVGLALHAVHVPQDVPAPASYAERFQTGVKPVDFFYSHVYGVDQAVRRLVELLKSRGAWENTILVFTSDNGATGKFSGGNLSLVPGNGPFRGHKGQVLQGGIRVPLVMVWPERIRSALRVEQTVSLMDVMPTVLEAAGIEVPAGLDGKSLLPVLKDPQRATHDRLFFTSIHAPSWGFTGKHVIGGDPEARRDLFPGAWAVVEGDWLLRFVGTLAPGLMDNCPTGQKAHFELFNIRHDPLEQYDLHATQPEVAARLTAAFREYAATLPPPPVWERRHWDEVMSSVGLPTAGAAADHRDQD